MSKHTSGTSLYAPSKQHAMTAEEILARALAKVKAATEATVKPVAAPTATTVPLSYPVFELSKQKSDIDAKEFKEVLLAKNVVQAGPSLLLPLKGNEKKGVAPPTWKYTPGDIRHPPDKDVYSKLANEPKLAKYAEQSILYYRSNGRRSGLCARMSDKLATQRTIQFNVFDSKHWNLVDIGFRLRTGHVMLEPAWLETEHPVMRKLNSVAAVGLPYMFEMAPSDTSSGPKIDDSTFLSSDLTKPLQLLKTSQPILVHGMNVCNYMMDGVGGQDSVGKAVKWFESVIENQPWINTFMLKRKDEKMLRSEFQVKVRPYGCQPLPMKLFCQTAVWDLESGLTNFLEDEESYVAYRYSPYYGGAKKLVDHFVKKLKKDGWCFISYGDDQLWAFSIPGGKFILIGPDVASMDMSTTNHVIVRLLYWIKRMYPKIKQRTYNRMAVWITLAFHHYMHVGGPYVLKKLNSLISGVPGTTFVNMFSSANIIALFKNFMIGITNEKNFVLYFRHFLNEMLRTLNFKFKDLNEKGETIEDLFKNVPHQYFNSPDDLYKTGISVPFLSMVILPHDGGFISVPSDMHKLGASLVLPGYVPPKETHEIRAARMLGIFLSGGWYDEDLAKFLGQIYTASKTFIKPTENNTYADEITTVGEEDIIRFVKESGWDMSTALPPRELMFKFHMLSFDDFRKFISETKGGFSGSSSTLSESEYLALDSELEAILQLENRDTQPRTESSSSSANDYDDNAGPAAAAGAAPMLPAVSSSSSSSSRDTIKTIITSKVDVGDLDQALDTLLKPTHSVKKMGHANALTIAQKKLKYEKAKARWLLRDEARRAAQALSGQILEGETGRRKKWNRMTSEAKDIDELQTTIRKINDEVETVYRDEYSEDDEKFNEADRAYASDRNKLTELEKAIVDAQYDEDKDETITESRRGIGFSWADADDEEDEVDKVGLDIHEIYQKMIGKQKFSDLTLE